MQNNAAVFNEAVRPQPDETAAKLRWLRRYTTILDSSISIPGTRISFGVDALLGLVPGVGDLVGLVLSLYVVYAAALFGLPVHALLRMCGRVIIDAIVGAVPIAGDLFDFAWKANDMNMAHIERYLNDSRSALRPRTPEQIGSLARAWLLGLFTVCVVAVGGVIVLLFRALSALMN